MRIWHNDLLDVLPNQQLLEQDRECCLIEHEILEKGSVSHVLVNFVNDDKMSLLMYHWYVIQEMWDRGYEVSQLSYDWFNRYRAVFDLEKMPYNMFEKKFKRRYLVQCVYNLQEKYDAGGITDDEWKMILEKFPWADK